MIRRLIYVKHAQGSDAETAARLVSRAMPPGDRIVRNAVLPALEGFTPEPLWDTFYVINGPAKDAALLPVLSDGRFERWVTFLATENVVIDGPRRGVNILSLPRRKEGLSAAEFSRHYSGVHGPLVARNPSFLKYANRYVQHHVMPDSVAASEGFIPYDGTSEFWFDSVEFAKTAWSAPDYLEQLRADEKNFVGNPPSHRLIVEEKPALS